MLETALKRVLMLALAYFFCSVWYTLLSFTNKQFLIVNEFMTNYYHSLTFNNFIWKKMLDSSILCLSFVLMTGCFNTSVLSMVSFTDIFVQPHTVASCYEECHFSTSFGLLVCSLLYL